MNLSDITIAENARPMTDANQTTGTGTEVLISERKKPMPIIDTDRIQGQTYEFRAGKRLCNIFRSNEGKTWYIIGKVGPYLRIRTKNTNGSSNIRLIFASAYFQKDCYPTKIPVYCLPDEMDPIIDADACQVARAAIRARPQREIIDAEAAE